MNTSRLDKLRALLLALHVSIDACTFCGVPLRTCYQSMHIWCEEFSCLLPIMMTPCLNVSTGNGDCRYLLLLHGIILLDQVVGMSLFQSKTLSLQDAHPTLCS